MSTWAGFQQSVVDKTIDQSRNRLDVYVHSQGGHFEQLLLTYLVACFMTTLNVFTVFSHWYI